MLFYIGNVHLQVPHWGRTQCCPGQEQREEKSCWAEVTDIHKLIQNNS